MEWGGGAGERECARTNMNTSCRASLTNAFRKQGVDGVGVGERDRERIRKHEYEYKETVRRRYHTLVSPVTASHRALRASGSLATRIG